MSNERLFLSSEVNQLEELLKTLPAENLIERISLESRLAKVQQDLAAMPEKEIEKIKLTFRGKPVLGSYGIAADFAAKAAGAFSESFSAVFAALSESLSSSGPIPKQDKSQLLITGTAIGSFGFEFDLPGEEQATLLNDSTAKQTVRKLESLMRLSVEGSDDEVAEAIEEIHPRAVSKLHAFMDILVQHQAWCALDTRERSFRFSGYEQIKKSSERLKDDNIQERPETFTGQFRGVLPESRTFEFALSDQEGVIRGKIDKHLSDPDILNKDWLYKPIKATFNLIQVGKGRPRYTLMSLSDLKSIE